MSSFLSLFQRKHRKLLYLVFGEGFSGVIQSQVLDVVDLLNRTEKVRGSVVCFISVRGYFSVRRRIKESRVKSFVFPLLFGRLKPMGYRLLLRLICFTLKADVVVGRGPVACSLALASRNTSSRTPKICYDGRGARTAELREYNQTHPFLEKMRIYEGDSILKADYRMSVTNALVDHWCEEFGYNRSEHSIVPCTLSSHFERVDFSIRDEVRQMLGCGKNTRLFVFSGSSAGWQENQLYYSFVDSLLENGNNTVLFLGKESSFVSKIKAIYPDRVYSKKVEHSEVAYWMTAGDYGLLIRESNTTNRVASPVKFAEYLACGLKVLCTPEIGDYSDFIDKHDVGFIIQDTSLPSEWDLVPFEEKQRIAQIAKRYFSKRSEKVITLYEEALDAMLADSF